MNLDLEPRNQMEPNSDLDILNWTQPGTPGGPWTEDQAEVIQQKLIFLWQNQISFSKKFCNKNSVDNKKNEVAGMVDIKF